MKYSRTFHLPWSPGGTKDDKKLKSVDHLLNTEIVITEKLDGSNSCLCIDGVFARSHAQSPKHASFDLLKQKFYTIGHLIKAEEQIFGENCFAVHSISYENLSDFFFVFNILNNSKWQSWNDVESRSQELGLKTCPVLFKGVVKSSKELEKITNELCALDSTFGGPREGVVVRVTREFDPSEFSTCVGKWVRKDHVQTDEHWMNQPIVKQKIKNEK